ncbi:MULTISPECIES: hypothetical protein [Pseudomonas]|uniref:hypothetical protein n=1 Tax=Pseudomonas TaxID=286 RepID=UPI0008DA3826|nr:MULTISPECIES: hypothetical protein [unclassified Pseudomonas]OHW38004.1 hypothetical protein BHC62_06710 [Pseudomonas sp. 06C 126]QHG24339.1 hypothetical protein GDV60_16330 [Pseudomonas sp. DTU12.1]
MIIKLSPFSPIDPAQKITLERRGEALVINGECFDFGPVPEGATLPMEAILSEWIAQPVSRVDGRLIICIRLPVGPDASASALYPADIFNPPSGNVRLPQ